MFKWLFPGFFGFSILRVMTENQALRQYPLCRSPPLPSFTGNFDPVLILYFCFDQFQVRIQPIRGTWIDICFVRIIYILISCSRSCTCSINTSRNSRDDVRNPFKGSTRGSIHDWSFLSFYFWFLFVVNFFLQIRSVVGFWLWMSPWKQVACSLSNKKKRNNELQNHSSCRVRIDNSNLFTP